MEPTQLIFLRRFIKSLVLVLLAVFTLANLHTAQAQSGSWLVDANGNWGTAANWTGGTIANDRQNTATFGEVISADRVVTLNSARSIGNITASDTSHNYTISGASNLTLDRTDTTAPTINVSTAGRTLTISSNILGTDGMQKTGAGTLTLGGVNTYTGNTTVGSGGALILASTGSLRLIVTDSTAYKITGLGSATLSGTLNVDTTAVTVSSGAWTLVDATTKTFGGTFAITGFTGPVGDLYTKTEATRFWTFNKSTGVLTLRTATMLTCNFGALGQALISDSTVVLAVPTGQPVTALAPTFTLATGATISPASGSTQNFTSPVVYRVTAENGTSFRDYTVSTESLGTWAQSGSMFIVTTPNGANIAAGVSVTDFPLLVRFTSANFNFAQAQSDGRDVRFTNSAGVFLPYQIEHWDAVAGKAAVWVRMPTISGNTTQEIKVHWGKSGVNSLSRGANVFSSANGYASVIHLGTTLTDETGMSAPSNLNSTVSDGLIGKARTFAAGQGVLCGTSLTGLPMGSGPFSTGVWVRTAKSPSDILGWGISEPSAKKTHMQLFSPPHIRMDCWFGSAGVEGTASIPDSEWAYVVHTFQTTGTRLYVNGVLDATNNGGTMNYQNPSRFEIGGWAGTYSFVGDIDEVRISKVVRSADWVKLEYENQKPLQTLLGGIVPAGSAFSVSPTSLTINETASGTLTAQAGGAQKVYWIFKKNGVDTVLATDQLSLDYTAPRVTGNDSAIIQFKAVFAGGVQTIDVPLTVNDTVPNPVFTLTPSTTQWDGRQTMTVTANITNLAAMQAAGFGTLNYQWTIGGVAVLKQESDGTLTLTRSQGSGPMTVTLAVDNGGAPISSSVLINVQEPASDPWLERTPDANEKPVSGQFFARNPGTSLGTVFYNGTQGGSPTTVYLKVYKTPSGGSETLDATHRQSLVGGAYAFSAPIAAGLFTYRVVYGTTTGAVDTDVATVTDLVCGDAYIFEGQSNALAAFAGIADETTTDPFIRTYGVSPSTWGLAIRKGSNFRIGYWGMNLALILKTTHNMPICIINGAVGGTRIDQHQPNPVDRTVAGSLYSIYANLLNRVIAAKLTHGIRGVFWHQGESNSGADSPTGDWDYKSHQQHFVDMSAAWRQDFPNIQKYIIFQVQPRPCALGPKGDQLRDVQRTLPRLYSKMSILSTIGIDTALGHDGCHYSPTGYQNFANLVAPLASRDFYNVVPSGSVTAPILQRAYYTNATRNQIALVFDQPTLWNSTSTVHFYLDDVAGLVTSGSHSGNVVTLQLSAASSSSTIDYVKDQVLWDNLASKLIKGSNNIAALTFADVAIGPPAPAGISAIGGNGQVALTWNATAGATGYNVKRSIVSGGPYTTIATATAPAFTDTTVVAGTPYFYVVSAVNTVDLSSSEGLDSAQATATPLGSYAAWAANPARGFTVGVNDAPLLDPDLDGINNLLEFVLNSTPMTASRAALPVVQQDGGQWVFEYDRHDDSLPPATTQIVQYGSDFVGWTDIAIPAASAGAVTITPGTPADRVKVVIPSLGGKVFVRLKVTQ